LDKVPSVVDNLTAAHLPNLQLTIYDLRLKNGSTSQIEKHQSLIVNQTAAQKPLLLSEVLEEA
jgi:hypothetical protein